MLNNFFGQLVFSYPEYFYILGLIPVYLIFLIFQKRKKKTVFMSVFADLVAAQKKTWRRFLPILKPILIVLILALSAFVLARPQVPHESTKIQKSGVDIFFAFDISESMLAEDLKPNRLEAAKTYIGEFIDRLETDRVGLLVFAGKPFTQSPLTFDYNVLSFYLKDVSTQTINQRVRGFNGTAIGDAMLLALSRFKKSEERTKVLILLTDGDANVGVDPALATELARDAGVKVYTIGIGNKNGALIPLGVSNGQKIYARNPDGSFAKTSFNESRLKEIAEATGGLYFYAENNTSLQKSFEQIQTLEKKELKAEMAVQYEERFFPFLLILLGCLSCFFVIELTVSIKE